MILLKMNHNILAGLLVTLLSVLLTENVFAGDIDKGGKIYSKHCAVCHGTDGFSVMPDAPNFAHSERLLRPDVFILAAIKEGNNAMPAFQGMLKDEEIMDVIAYMRTLENGGPIRP